MIKLTDEEIMDIWNKIPPQNDPTGKKFALAFARAVLAAQEKS